MCLCVCAFVRLCEWLCVRVFVCVSCVRFWLMCICVCDCMCVFCVSLYVSLCVFGTCVLVCARFGCMSLCACVFGRVSFFLCKLSEVCACMGVW